MSAFDFELPSLQTGEFFERFAGPAAFLVWDGTCVQLVHANEEYRTTLGLSNIEPLEIDLFSTMEEQYREPYRQAVALAAKTNCEQICESLRHAFNQCCGISDIWVRTRLRRVEAIPDGCLVFASIRDITEEMQGLESISESDRRFRYAAEQANVYAWEYTFGNKQMRPCYRCMRDLGLPALLENYPEPAIEMGIFPPDYADMYRDWHRQLEEEGKDSIEGIIPLTPDRIPFHVRYTTVRDADGKPFKAYGSATQVVNSEKEQEYRNIISCLGKAYFCVYHIDLTSGEYSQLETASIRVVDEAIKRQGKAADAFLGMSKNLVVADQADEVLRFTDITTIAQRLQDKDTIGIHFKGPHVGWCEGLFVAEERDAQGNCIHVLWGVRSIQEEMEKEDRRKKELEEARRAAEVANEAKTNFLFNMSHDIRTPMNAIMGFADLLEKYQGDPDRCTDYLRKIKNSSSVLLDIINNVLDMARIEKGAATIEESAWSIKQLDDSLYSVFAEMMKAKGLEFTHTINVRHPYIYCDVTKSTQVFTNILSNAYKYTEPGGRVEMRIEELESAQEGYAIYRNTISDTGIGMSADFLPHLFDEFSRERTSTETKVQGTGLGMPIVKRLVEFMGGTVEVTSEQGVGSSFVVTLPCRIANESDLNTRPNVEFDSNLFKGKRVLLAEDNDLNAEIAIEILSEAGFAVERAEDGLACIDMLQASNDGYYDVILMDIQMPHIDGYEASRAIRTMEDAAKATIPILAMTANAFEEDKHKAFQSGMDGHLAKPININELMSALADKLF